MPKTKARPKPAPPAEPPPTAAEVKAEPAGRRLDGWVLAHVYGGRHPLAAEPDAWVGFSANVSDGWDVFRRCCDWPPSQRIRFVTNLELQAEYPTMGLHFLVQLRDTFPLAVCRAALLTLAQERERESLRAADAVG
jgi:hypothetical protein